VTASPAFNWPAVTPPTARSALVPMDSVCTRIEDGARRAVLHQSVAGWVESLALAYRARRWASRITQVRCRAVDRLALSEFEPFDEVSGVSDTCWRGGETVIAVYRGKARLFSSPELQIAMIYSGIAEAPLCLDY
jgi:hypothetical protein